MAQYTLLGTLGSAERTQRGQTKARAAVRHHRYSLRKRLMEATQNESPKPEAGDSAVATPPLQQGEAPQEPKKKKRKYTVSEKVLKASRQNLEKANLAPHWWKYRLTERRLAACYNSLEKAVAVLRQFDSPCYGLGFKRGTHCASLRRSLGLAGEKREDYEAHLELMQQAFGPLDERQRKLVQAAGEAVWRRLRVFRGQYRWELYAVVAVLMEFIAEREQAAAAAERGEPVDPRLDPFGPRRAGELGNELLGLLLENSVEVDHEARRLNVRIGQLLGCLAPGGPRLGQEGERRSKEPDYDGESAAALGNPLRPAAQVEATLEPEREKIKGTDKWQGRGGTGSESASGSCQNAADLVRRGGLLRLLHQRGLGGTELSRLEGPEGKAAWMELWARAFEIGEETRNSKLETRPPDAVSSGESTASGSEPSAILTFAEMLWERIQMLRRHGDKETANVREALEAGVSARRAAGIDDCRSTIDDCPANETRNSEVETGPEGIDDCRLPIADCKTATTDPSAPGSEPAKTAPTGEDAFQSSIDNRRSAIRLLGALAVYSCVGAVLEAHKDLKAAYYRLLVTLYGALPGFHFFKPKKPTLDDTMANLSRLTFQLLPMKDGPLERQEQREIKWRGGSGGAQTGGGP